MYLFDGGFASFDANGAVDGWYYYIHDYMGNNRMVVNSGGAVEQVTHYYPYGGVIGDISTNENVQKYKFEGKELDRTFGLDNYDIHARQYFAMMPMWDRIDPLAEKYYGISPYVYCGGDPVNFGDYNGLDTIYFTIGENENIAQFSSRVSGEGNHIGIIQDNSGAVITTFGFINQGDADIFTPDNSEVMDLGVMLVSREFIKDKLNPIPNDISFFKALSYAAFNSKGQNATMDFVNQPWIQKKGLIFLPNDGSYLAHDNFNFGNYLWGAAMRKLGISYGMAVFGAHVENYYFSDTSRWHIDSFDDQISIALGYNGGDIDKSLLNTIQTYYAAKLFFKDFR
jgi:RHS repeat-associated protein